jgi:hypothetical protein
MSEVAVAKQNIDERLENVFRQLLDLYERHAQERQIIIKEKEELSKLTHLLVNQTKEIGQYETGIRKRIQDCIKDSSEVAIREIEKSVADKSSQAVAQLLHKIDNSFASIEDLIKHFRHEKWPSAWKTIGIAIMGSVITALLIVWLFMPKPTLPLSNEQLSYLQEGQMLAQMWPKLTKQEQARLKAVSYEVLHSHSQT